MRVHLLIAGSRACMDTAPDKHGQRGRDRHGHIRCFRCAEERGESGFEPASWLWLPGGSEAKNQVKLLVVT